MPGIVVRAGTGEAASPSVPAAAEAAIASWLRRWTMSGVPVRNLGANTRLTRLSIVDDC
jgi:hypothetical protein